MRLAELKAKLKKEIKFNQEAAASSRGEVREWRNGLAIGLDIAQDWVVEFEKEIQEKINSLKDSKYSYERGGADALEWALTAVEKPLGNPDLGFGGSVNTSSEKKEPQIKVPDEIVTMHHEVIHLTNEKKAKVKEAFSKSVSVGVKEPPADLEMLNVSVVSSAPGCQWVGEFGLEGKCDKEPVAEFLAGGMFCAEHRVKYSTWLDKNYGKPSEDKSEEQSMKEFEDELERRMMAQVKVTTKAYHIHKKGIQLFTLEEMATLVDKATNHPLFLNYWGQVNYPQTAADKVFVKMIRERPDLVKKIMEEKT